MESGSSNIDCGDKRIYFGKNRITAVKLYSSLTRVCLMS